MAAPDSDPKLIAETFTIESGPPGEASAVGCSEHLRAREP